jgi:hypothetical protein
VVLALSLLTGFAFRHSGILSCWNFLLCTPTVSVAMSSPIGFREFSEDEYPKTAGHEGAIVNRLPTLGVVSVVPASLLYFKF